MSGSRRRPAAPRTAEVRVLVGPAPPGAAPTPPPSSTGSCPACGKSLEPPAAPPPRKLPESIRPGVVLRHKIAKVDMVVIELEGEGRTGWFTVRFPDMSTWRVCPEEIEAPEPDPKKPGQYL